MRSNINSNAYRRFQATQDERHQYLLGALNDICLGQPVRGAFAFFGKLRRDELKVAEGAEHGGHDEVKQRPQLVQVVLTVLFLVIRTRAGHTSRLTCNGVPVNSNRWLQTKVSMRTREGRR